MEQALSLVLPHRREEGDETRRIKSCHRQCAAEQGRQRASVHATRAGRRRRTPVLKAVDGVLRDAHLDELEACVPATERGQRARRQRMENSSRECEGGSVSAEQSAAE